MLTPAFTSTQNYILSNYRTITNKNGYLNQNNYFNYELQLIYKNSLKYTFAGFYFSFNNTNQNPINNNIFINQLTILNAIEGSLFNKQSKFRFYYSRYLPKQKTSLTFNASLIFQLNNTYANNILTTATNNIYKLECKTSTRLSSITIESNTTVSTFVNSVHNQNAKRLLLLEQSFSLKKSITDNSFISLNNQLNIIYQKHQQTITFFYPDFYFTYNFKKINIDAELGAQNILNKKTFATINYFGNTEIKNQIELRPFQLLLKISFYFR